MTYACDSEDGNAAAILITNLESGDVAAYCPACLPAFADSFYRSIIGDPEGPVDAVPTEPGPDDPSDDDEDHDDRMTTNEVLNQGADEVERTEQTGTVGESVTADA